MSHVQAMVIYGALVVEQRRVLGHYHDETLETQELLAAHLMKKGELQEGQRQYEAALAAYVSVADLHRAGGYVPPGVIKQSAKHYIYGQLRYALILYEVGLTNKSRAIAAKVAKTKLVLTPDYKHKLMSILFRTSQFQEAEPLFREEVVYLSEKVGAFAESIIRLKSQVRHVRLHGLDESMRVCSNLTVYMSIH